MNKYKTIQRKRRITSKVRGTAKHPRLAVFRSDKHIYAQLIDDSAGVTLAYASDVTIGDAVSKVKRAENVGRSIAEKAVSLKIKTVRFDRGGFAYHGRVKSLAEAARTNGLDF